MDFCEYCLTYYTVTEDSQLHGKSNAFIDPVKILVQLSKLIYVEFNLGIVYGKMSFEHLFFD